MTIAARVLIGVMTLTVAWAAWLIAIGGVDLRLGGVVVTSYDPLRPLIIASVAFALYTALTGASAMRDRLARLASRIDYGVMALLLAAVMTSIAAAYSITAVMVSDTYGYVSEADLWIAGDLRVPQPWVLEAPWPDPRWTFTPLAYRPIERDGVQEIVPIVSPGLPLLMAAAKVIGGQELLFWVVPFAAGVLVLATYGIGRRLGSAGIGLMAAWFVGTSPTVLFMSMVAMSDVPAAAAWAVAVFCALGSGSRSALFAGLSVAMAILIRPNLAPVAAVIPIWFALRRADGEWKTRAMRIAVFTMAALPGPAITMAVYAWLYGSSLESGYGSLENMFALTNVPANVRNYLGWFIGTQTLAGIFGIIALAVPVRALWPWVEDRRALLMGLGLSAFITAQYLAYEPFDLWWFLRFFLPCWPFVMLGLATVVAPLLRARRVWIALGAGWFVIALGVLTFHEAFQRGTFDAWRGERRYVDIARELATRTPTNSVIYTELHSGSLRYYGGRLTVRFDLLHPEWLDRSAAWFRDRGTHAYLLLELWEIDDFKKRFAGQTLAEELESRLTLVYKGPSVLHLYDLTHEVSGPPAIVQGDDMRAHRSAAPVPEAFSLGLPK